MMERITITIVAHLKDNEYQTLRSLVDDVSLEEVIEKFPKLKHAYIGSVVSDVDQNNQTNESELINIINDTDTNHIISKLNSDYADNPTTPEILINPAI